MKGFKKWLIAHPGAAALLRHAVAVTVAVLVSLGATVEFVAPHLVAACALLVDRPSGLSLSLQPLTPSRGLI